MADEIRVQVKFAQDGLHDALYYTLEEYQNLGAEDLSTAKSERVASWQAAKANPPAPPEPTKEQLESDIKILEDTLTDFRAKLAVKVAQEGGK